MNQLILQHNTALGYTCKCKCICLTLVFIMVVKVCTFLSVALAAVANWPQCLRKRSINHWKPLVGLDADPDEPDCRAVLLLLLFCFVFSRQSKVLVLYVSSVLCGCHGKTWHVKLDYLGQTNIDVGKMQFCVPTKFCRDTCVQKGSLRHLNTCVKNNNKNNKLTRANQASSLYLM